MFTAKKVLLYCVVFVVTLVLTFLLLYLIFGLDREPKKVTLKVVGFWQEEVFTPLKQEYQEKNPHVTIEYRQRDPENYFATLKSDLGKEEATPDLFWWHSGWGPLLLENLDALPGGILSEKDFEKTFYPITKTDLKLSGSYRGLPLEIDGLALLYNKDLLAAKNFKEPPATWASLRQVYGQVLTTRDKDRLISSAIALGTANNVENFSEIVGLFLLQNDVQIIKNNKLNIKESKSSRGTNLVSDALGGYTDFSKENKIWDSTLPNSIEAFAQGKTAMVILPAHKIHDLLATLKKNNLKLNFAVAAVPQLPNSDKVTWGSYWSLGVSQNSQAKEESWKLANFITAPSSLRTVFKLESEKSDFGRAYPRVEMAREQTTHPYLAAYLSQAKTAKSWYLHSGTFDNALNDNLVTELAKVVSEIEKGRTSESSAASLAEKFEPILKKYNLIQTPSTK
jgi:ABC-type glycerol-3-phosphate transport system substrate-binding protein